MPLGETPMWLSWQKHCYLNILLGFVFNVVAESHIIVVFTVICYLLHISFTVR